jgi:hypothetical protein
MKDKIEPMVFHGLYLKYYKKERYLSWPRLLMEKK